MSVTEQTRRSSRPLRHAQMLIAGAWVDSASGETLEVENPGKRQRIAEIPRGQAIDVERAVQAATQAFRDWSKVPPRDRGRMLLRIADALESRGEELARIIALETGNALRTQARSEARLSADIFRYFGGLASELKGETIPLGEHVLSYTRREPLGVVGAIIPWNAPVLLGALKIAPSLCAGNTLVLKAAEDAPLGVLLMAEVCQEFLPPGVLNVLTGLGEECGAALSQHPAIRKLSFTGSTEVGKMIMRAAADRIVPVSLELGGKSPSIVYPDADEDWVVDGVIAGMRFTRQSQSCTAGSRLFLHADIFDSFLDKLRAKTLALKLGDPLDETTDIGAIINDKQFRKVCGYVDEGLKRKDARLVFGGLPPKDGPLSEGYFALPTVFADASNDWRLAREEIFGPVLVAIPWRDEAEAIRMANDSHYGLAAYVWTHDIGSALRTAHAIESGWVQVNQGLGQQPGHSYGGYKQSGIGREFSLEGMLDSFTQRKNVTVNLNTLGVERNPMATHPALTTGRTAVVTGAASGIGLAAAKRFAAMGLKVCLADLSQQALDAAVAEVARASPIGKNAVMAVPTDVSKLDDVGKLRDAVYGAFGEVGVLMNNAGTSPGGGPWEHIDRWRRVLEVNLWGVINGVQSFAPRMLEQGTPGAIINTGSKQGITCPPGDTAYNVSKAGVKVMTEALAHSLRNAEGARITAHLLIPGSTFTGMTSRGRSEKPPGAWTPDQVVDTLIDGMNRGDFYILCPDNEVTRDTDNRRILWAAQDITQNRPALSRWHPDYSEAFAEFLRRQ